MNQIPTFWRTEIWHPLSVHFPIALLTIATLFYLVSFFLPDSKKKMWHSMSGILLIIGVASAWVGIYTGNKADGAVARTICDPVTLKNHEISAYTSSIIFSVTAFLFILKDLSFLKKAGKILSLVILAGLLTGSGYLIYAGHLGATVVYQQGAGVFHPSEDCAEFAD